MNFYSIDSSKLLLNFSLIFLLFIILIAIVWLIQKYSVIEDRAISVSEVRNAFLLLFVGIFIGWLARDGNEADNMGLLIVGILASFLYIAGIWNLISLLLIYAKQKFKPKVSEPPKIILK